MLFRSARLSSDAEIEVTETSGFLEMTPAVASLDMARPPSQPLLRAHTVGTATLIATWSGTTTSASISVSDDVVNVNAVSLAVVNASAAAGGGVTLYGVRFSRHATALRVDLDGGVSYSGADAAALDLVSYSSDAPTAVEPGEDGEPPPPSDGPPEMVPAGPVSLIVDCCFDSDYLDVPARLRSVRPYTFSGKLEADCDISATTVLPAVWRDLVTLPEDKALSAVDQFLAKLSPFAVRACLGPIFTGFNSPFWQSKMAALRILDGFVKKNAKAVADRKSVV